MNKNSFFSELKRRNVYKVAVAYAVAAWLLIQIATQVFPFFEIPNWAVRLVVIVLMIGFPIALVLSWAFEITPEGIKRESEINADKSITHHTGRKIVAITIVLAVIAAGLLALQLWGPKRSTIAPKQDEATVVPEKSIAVLPFENLSDDKSNSYFSDGITEEILNALAQIPNLKVAARRSAFQFKGNDLDLKKIGLVLGVGHIVEGSLQKAGDQVRINVRLVDVQKGLQVWSDKYDRKLDNVFAIEDEIAKAIATRLRVQLTGGGGQPLVADSTSNPQAHELYLRGLGLLAARGRGLREAGDLFQQAVQLDDSYAQAWGALAITHLLLPAYRLESYEAALPNGEAAAQRALSLDSNTASAYVAVGLANTARCRWPEADQAFHRALALAPGDAEAVNQYAQFLSVVGQLQASLREIERAQQLDPLSPIIAVIHSKALAALRRDDAADSQFRSVLKTHPEFAPAHAWAATYYIDRKMFTDAETELRLLGELHGQSGEAKALVTRGMADPTQHAAALSSLETSPDNADLREDPVLHAFYLVSLGERDRALNDLELYAANQRTAFANWVWDRAFDPLRDDPRFKAVLTKLALPYNPASAPKS
ncbi:MAG: adenylate cyclase [Verrucomicrobiota bacterium]